jgi:hypothetical protein
MASRKFDLPDALGPTRNVRPARSTSTRGKFRQLLRPRWVTRVTGTLPLRLGEATYQDFGTRSRLAASRQPMSQGVARRAESEDVALGQAEGYRGRIHAFAQMRARRWPPGRRRHLGPLRWPLHGYLPGGPRSRGSALDSAISTAGVAVSQELGCARPLGAPSLAPIHSGASAQPSKRACAPARRRRRSQFCNRPMAGASGSTYAVPMTTRSRTRPRRGHHATWACPRLHPAARGRPCARW